MFQSLNTTNQKELLQSLTKLNLQKQTLCTFVRQWYQSTRMTKKCLLGSQNNFQFTSQRTTMQKTLHRSKYLKHFSEVHKKFRSVKHCQMLESSQGKFQLLLTFRQTLTHQFQQSTLLQESLAFTVMQTSKKKLNKVLTKFTKYTSLWTLQIWHKSFFSRQLPLQNSTTLQPTLALTHLKWQLRQWKLHSTQFTKYFETGKKEYVQSVQSYPWKNS